MYTRFFATLLLIAVAAGIAYSITTDSITSERGLNVRWGMTMTTILLGVQLAAAGFFDSGVRNYQKRFRSAFTLLGVAFIIMGLGQIQLPFIVLTHSLDSIWVTWGIVLLPYMLTFVLTFISMRSMALELGLSFFATKWWRVIVIALSVALIATVLPHIRINTPQQEFAYDVYVAVMGWSLTFCAATWLISRRIANSLGPLYRPAMKLLALSFALHTISWILEWCSNLFLNSNNWFTQRGLEFAPMLVATLVGLLAAIAFKEISRQTIPANASFIDVVTSVASLVSEPQRIDSFLENVRVMTSRFKPGQEPNEGEKAELVRTYKAIEEYIVTQEPLRKFSREELRARLPDHFVQAL